MNDKPVERFSFSVEHEIAYQDANGAWVKFAAYEALQKENAELKEINDSLHRSSQFTYECQKKAIDDLKQENAAQAKRIAKLEEDLQFVERWASHHGTKPNVTAQEALSCIQHYPSIEEITKSYKDGVIPKTRNPYAEIESLRKQVEELRSHLTAVVEEINHLMNDSKGVAGLHLNGDIAPWASLLRGGEFDTWLSYLSDAAEYIQSKNGE